MSSTYLSRKSRGERADIVSHGKGRKSQHRVKVDQPEAVEAVIEQGEAPTTPSLGESVGALSMGAHVVRQLRRQLSVSQQEVEKLQKEVDELRRERNKVSEEGESSKATNKSQAKKMVQVIERLLDDRNELRIRVDLLQNERNDTQKHATELQAEVETLRGLIKRDLRGETVVKKRTEAEQRFWDEVATPEVLVQSKPPRDFMGKSSDRAASDRDIEQRKLKSLCIKLQEELKAAKNAAHEASSGNLSIRATLSKTQQEASDKLHRSEQHLVGAMRRIQFLLSKQEEDKNANRDQEHYIMRLERKLLDQDKKIQQLRRKLKQSDISDAPQQPAPAMNDSFTDAFVGYDFDPSEIAELRKMRD